jgi:hypothetical protein
MVAKRGVSVDATETALLYTGGHIHADQMIIQKECFVVCVGRIGYCAISA